MFCSKCGTQLAEGAEFCSKCGARQMTAEPTEVHCAECGWKLAPHNTKCLHCGAPRAGSDVPSESVVRQGSNIGRLVFAAVIGLVVFWFVSSQLNGSSRTSTTLEDVNSAPAASETVRVTYRVFGSETDFASMTYTNAQGGTEQQNGQNISRAWETTFSAESGAYVYLSAQNSSESGSVTCEIRVDGGAFKHSVSSGGYGIASCSGALP